MRDEDGLAAFRACVERTVAGFPSRGSGAAEDLAARIVEAAGADPDSVRRILGDVLRKALDPAEVERISEAFGDAGPSAPSPR